MMNIEKKIQVRNSRTKILGSKDFRRIHDLTVAKDGGKVDSSIMYENVPMRQGYFDSSDQVICRYNPKYKQTSPDKVKQFTKGIISVRIEDTNVGELNLNSGIWMYPNMMGSYNFAFSNGLGKWFDFTTQEVIDFNPSEIPDAVFYKVFGYSASKLRRGTVFMINATEGNQYAEDLLDAATCGAYSMNKGKKLNFKQLARMASHLFLFATPSKKIGEINDFLMFTGKVKDENGNEFMDGGAIVSAKFYADCLSNVLGVNVATEAVVGEGIQARFATAKTFSIVQYVDNFVKSIKETSPKYFTFKNKSEFAAVQSEVYDPTSKYANAWIQVGDCPEVIFDRNALKLDCDLSRQLDFNVLDIAISSTAKASQQMLQKALYSNTDLTVAAIKVWFEEQLDKELKRSIFERKVSVPSLKVVESLYATGILKDINPEYCITKDKSIGLDIVKTEVERRERILNRSNYALEGSNLRAFVDIAPLFGVERILKYGEAFTKDAAKNKVNRACIFKYPTIGIKEYYQADLVSVNEIKKRVKDLNCSKAIKDVLFDFYVKLSDGVCVMPADEDLKKQLAGMDFDYDGVTAIYDEKFNEIISMNNKPLIVRIESDQVKSEVNSAIAKRMIAKYKVSEEYEFGIDALATAFLKQISNSNEGIGSITNTNSSQVALMFVDPNKAVSVIQAGFGTKGTGQYQGLKVEKTIKNGIECDTISITPISADLIAKEIEGSKIDKDSVEKILFDLNVVYRMYQEMTIDSAKSGDKVNINVSLKDFAWAKSLGKIDHELKDDQYIFKPKKQSPKIKEVSFDDTLWTTSVELCREAKEIYNNLLLPNITAIEYTAEELAMFQEYGLVKYADLIASIRQLKSYYGNITSDHIKVLSNTDKDDDDGRTLEGKRYKGKLAVLASMLRRLTAGLTPVERAVATKYVSMINSTGLRRDGGNGFASSVLPAEYLLMVIEKWGGLDYAGHEIINPKCVDGDVVSLVNGVSDHGMIEANYTGDLMVKEIDGRIYAGRKITEIINVPSPTNMIMLKLDLGETCPMIDEQVKVNATMVKGKPNYNIVDSTGKVLCNIDTSGKLFNKMINGVTGLIKAVDNITVTGRDNKQFEMSLVTLEIDSFFEDITAEDIEIDLVELDSDEI